MGVTCPTNYKCMLEPQWPPEQWLPLWGMGFATVIIVALLIAWSIRRK